MNTEQPSAPPRDISTRDGYDLWASICDEEENPLIVLEEHHVGGLLGPVTGLEIVDIGCGTGRHAIRLAANGARVTGPGLLA